MNDELSSTERREILARLDSLLGPQRGSMGIEITPDPGIPRACLRALLAQLPKESGITPNERRELGRLTAERKQLVTRLAEFGRDRIPAALATRQFDAAKKLASGEAATGTTREAVTDEFLGSRLAIKTQLRANDEAVTAIVTRVATRLAPHVGRAADNELLAEFSRFEKFGLAFQPTILSRTLRGAKNLLAAIAEGKKAGGLLLETLDHDDGE